MKDYGVLPKSEDKISPGIENIEEKRSQVFLICLITLTLRRALSLIRESLKRYAE